MSSTQAPPIKRKLISIIMVTSTVALLLACGAFVAFDTFTFRKSQMREASLLADIIGRNCTAAISFNDPQVAQETLGVVAIPTSRDARASFSGRWYWLCELHAA